MPKLVNRIMRLIAAVMTAIIMLSSGVSTFQSKVSADSLISNYTYQYDDFGVYPTIDNEDELADYIRQRVLAGEGEICFYYTGSFSGGFTDYVRSIMNNRVHAHTGVGNEGDYLYGRVADTISTIIRTRGNTKIYFGKISLRYKSSTEQELAESQAVDAILQSLHLEGKTDYQKILAIYNWISSNVSYDFASVNSVNRDPICYTAYAAAINRCSVCQGMSSLMYHMLLNVGIDNRIIYCDEDNHSWNVVRLNGLYYNLDVTNDLATNPANYSHFLVPCQGYFASTHTLNDPIYSDPNYVFATSRITSDPGTVSSNSIGSTTPGFSSNKVDNSVDKSKIVGTIEPEDRSYAEAFVERLYVNMIGRSSDVAGLNAWVTELGSDRINGNDLADGFYYSNEFSNISNGLSNRDFVGRMYVTILGRNPDRDGLEAWTGILDRGEQTREEVYKGFLGSDEWREMCSRNDILSGHYQIGRFVDRLYTIVLGRTPDSSGRQAWVNAIVSGENSAYDVAYGFVFSSEYVNRHTQDDNYVVMLYNTVLDRDPDIIGLLSWIAVIESGKTRLEVFNGFMMSAEFATMAESYGMRPY